MKFQVEYADGTEAEYEAPKAALLMRYEQLFGRFEEGAGTTLRLAWLTARWEDRKTLPKGEAAVDAVLEWGDNVEDLNMPSVDPSPATAGP